MRYIKKFINEGASFVGDTDFVRLTPGNDKNNPKEVLKSNKSPEFQSKSSGFKLYSGLNYDPNAEDPKLIKKVMDALKNGKLDDRELFSFIQQHMVPIMQPKLRRGILDNIVVLGSSAPLANKIGDMFYRLFYVPAEKAKYDWLNDTPALPNKFTLNKLEYPDVHDMILWDTLREAEKNDSQHSTLRRIESWMKAYIDIDKTTQDAIEDLEFAFKEGSISKLDSLLSLKDSDKTIHWKAEMMPAVIKKTGNIKSSVINKLNHKYDYSSAQFVNAVKRCVLGGSMLIIDDNMHERLDIRRLLTEVKRIAEDYSKSRGIPGDQNWTDRVFTYVLYDMGGLDPKHMKY